MSFSKNVKKELCELRESSRYYKKILLCGIIYGLKRHKNKLNVSLDNISVITLLKKLLPETKYTINEKYMAINGENFKYPDEYLKLIGDDKSGGVFLRGVFISAGVVADPGLEYHLELSLPDDERNDVLYNLINERGITIKKSRRKNAEFLYIKESDIISDFLTFIGAVHSAMEIMNVKIYKELRNKVNRTVNCETANIVKTVRAAARQLDDIELILKLKGMEFLSEDLSQVARLRYENAEMSLKEIADLCVPRISRSGVNHRLNRIGKIAEELRKFKKASANE
ncbi:MAG: DNA-binding protein WhiA [Eubacterium sp.]|jgi:DNA-binding transcriptional regulator WhiA|nr:DNA-binding protein WhiA [Eubacterium sp.]